MAQRNDDTLGVVMTTVIAVGIFAFTAGSLIGWVLIWDWITGWWSPGWGNLFTVVVALAAVGVSAWFNRKTLANAQHQFAETRKDARTDKLRTEIIAYVAALGERLTQRRKIVRVLDEWTRELGQVDVADLPRVQKNAEAIVAEHTSDVYRRINGHAFAIQMLTDDPEIGWPVTRIQLAIGEEERLARQVVGDGIAAGLRGDAAAAAIAEADFRKRESQRDKQVVTELRTLLKYSLMKLGGPGAETFWAQFTDQLLVSEQDATSNTAETPGQNQASGGSASE